MSVDLAYKKVELAPPYVPVLQKPSCCAAACLSMILYRRGFGLYDQEELARIMDIPIYEGSRQVFSPGMRFVNERGAFRTVESADSINKALLFYRIPLAAKAHRASEVNNLGRFLTDNLGQNNDVWAEFHTDERNGISLVHDNVVQALELGSGGGFVTTIDPSPRYIQRARWPIGMLERAVGTTYGRECGFITVGRRPSRLSRLSKAFKGNI